MHRGGARITPMPLDDASPRTGTAPGLGHNGGPPLDEEPVVRDWNYYCWRRAHARA
jgi:hypothetical protein